MRPHRSGFQLDTTVCVQIGEAIVYQIGRPQAGSRAPLLSIVRHCPIRRSVNPLVAWCPLPRAGLCRGGHWRDMPRMLKPVPLRVIPEVLPLRVMP